jgi:hypothetical protein
MISPYHDSSMGATLSIACNPAEATNRLRLRSKPAFSERPTPVGDHSVRVQAPTPLLPGRSPLCGGYVALVDRAGPMAGLSRFRAFILSLATG